MVRPRTPIPNTKEDVRKGLIADFNEPIKEFVKRPAKNVYIVNRMCPYADKKTGHVLESVYIYWKYYPKDIIHPDEFIYHLNNDRTDNRIENLSKKQKQKRNRYLR
jgi:hypothetical protein